MKSTARCLAFSLPFLLWSLSSQANPYPDPAKVAKIIASEGTFSIVDTDVEVLKSDAEPVLRVILTWDAAQDRFQLTSAVKELSGTPSLLRRSTRKNPLGSYHGMLVDPETGEKVAFDALGTGSEFRKLSRALAFRFPFPSKNMILRVEGENPKTGVQELLLEKNIDIAQMSEAKKTEPTVKLLRASMAAKKLIVGIYAEGYREDRQENFWADAAKTVQTLADQDFPMMDNLEFYGVFSSSATELGAAKNLGTPVAVRDSHLSLYYPYWNNFGRWYHVVYPTSVERYRNALGQIPYDYPVALVDSNEYWGVGNFNELTAVPSRSLHFVYLLMHEFGHFFGLNEEYNSGGPTELQFAPEISEPWSQNITFLADIKALKWASFVSRDTPIPTSLLSWRGNGPWGAYAGGYAESEPRQRSHKPGLACMMDSGKAFCPICTQAIKDKILFDLN